MRQSTQSSPNIRNTQTLMQLVPPTAGMPHSWPKRTVAHFGSGILSQATAHPDGKSTLDARWYFCAFIYGFLHAKTLWTRVQSRVSRWMQSELPAADCPSIAITLAAYAGGAGAGSLARRNVMEPSLGSDALSVLGCVCHAVSWQKRICICLRRLRPTAAVCVLLAWLVIYVHA